MKKMQQDEGSDGWGVFLARMSPLLEVTPEQVTSHLKEMRRAALWKSGGKCSRQRE